MAFRPAGQLLKNALFFGLPRTPKAALARFGPDVLINGLYAATAPEEYVGGLGGRAGLFLEGLAFDAAGGMGGAALGGLGARAAGQRYRSAQDFAGTGDLVGSIGTSMLTGPLGLRPVTRHLDEQAQKNAELQAELERQGIFEQGIQAAAHSLGNTNFVQAVDGVIPYG